MKSLKSTLIAGALSLSFALPTLASEIIPPTSVPIFSAAETASLFEHDAKPMELAALSSQEMQETEGAVIWFAPLAWGGFKYALTGFTRHGLNQVISRSGVGVSNQAILSALKNPTTAYSDVARQTTRFVGKDATVILNQNGQVVTAWGKPR